MVASGRLRRHRAAEVVAVEEEGSIILEKQ
jgi:hypothetical protein